MGYRTYHSLTVIPDIQGDHKANIGILSKYGDELWTDEQKWYDEESDMLAYSKRYPGLLFIVDGQGEENTDIWRHWYFNGVMQGWRLEYSVPEDPPEPWP